MKITNLSEVFNEDYKKAKELLKIMQVNQNESFKLFNETIDNLISKIDNVLKS